MSNSAAELDHSIFGFIDALSGLSDSAAIVDALHRALATEGVRFFCFNFLPQPGESFQDVVLANRWPQDWLSLYVAENYVQDDPAIRVRSAALGAGQHAYPQRASATNSTRERESALRRFRQSRGEIPTVSKRSAFDEHTQAARSAQAPRNVARISSRYRSVNITSTLGKNGNTATRRTRGCLPVCRNG